MADLQTITKLASLGLTPTDLGSAHKLSLAVDTLYPVLATKSAADVGTALGIGALLTLLVGGAKGLGRTAARMVTDDPKTFAERAKRLELAAAYRSAARRLQAQTRPASSSTSDVGDKPKSIDSLRPPGANAVYG